MKLAVSEVAAANGVDERTVRRLIQRRNIPAEFQNGGRGRPRMVVESRHLPDDWASAVYAFMARDGASLTFEPDRTYKAAAAALKPTARLKLDARLEILTAFDRFAANTDTARTRARKAFCDAYNRRLLTPAHTPPAWVFESIPRIAWRTLFDWERRFEREGPAGVARITSGRRPGHSAFDRDTELNEWLRTHLIELPSIALPTLHKRAVDRFGEERVPSLRALQRWATSYRRDNAGQLLALQNPDAWKGRYQPAFGSHSEKVTRLNQIWEIDATPADVMTADGRRQTVVGVLDVYSRRAKVLITDHSRATAVAALLRAAIMDWGIPEVLKRDNGKDFCAAHVDRVLDALDIRAQNCPPFTPEAKPHIERFFGTLARGLYELLPGYVGHNVADRKAIESRRSFAERFGAAGDVIEVALTAKELQEKTALWIEAHYERAPHKGLGGRSPFEAATAWPHPIRTVNNERVLDHLLMEAPDTHGIRRVTKSGIRAEGATFIAPELAGLIGERVHVRLDPADMGRVVVYSADQTQFICIAEAPERAGIDRQAMAVEAKRRAAAERKALRADHRAAKRRHKPHRIADELLGRAHGDAAKVTALPKRSESVSTPAAEAARTAAQGGHQIVDDITPEDEARVAARLAEIEARNGDGVVPFPARPRPEAATPAPEFENSYDFAEWISEHWDEASEGQRQRFDELAAMPTFARSYSLVKGKKLAVPGPSRDTAEV